ncbi:MAG TPA: hypothetical protein VF297_30790 [Pyrinomonadaceae bacterium]
MPGILFDTSVYISVLRRGNASVLSSRRAARSGESRDRPLWLSAVVLEELLVGGRDRSFLRALRGISSGRVLALIGEKYGYEDVGRARMTNDALIAMSTSRNGIVARTMNDDDYRKIAEFRPFEWERT